MRKLRNLLNGELRPVSAKFTKVKGEINFSAKPKLNEIMKNKDYSADSKKSIPSKTTPS